MNGRCDICGGANIIQWQQNHFREVCFGHARFASYFILPIGVNPNDPNSMQCLICDQQLSVNERTSIPPNHFMRTCYRHREFGGRFDSLRLRQQFAAGQLVSKYDIELRTQLLATALAIYATN
jgi:hypothetical protein